MTPVNLLKVLGDNLIDVTLKDDQLCLRGNPGVPHEIQKMVREHKTELIQHLQVGAKNIIEVDKNVPYKSYVYPSGDVLELTREEFDSIVDLFRTLKKWRDEAQQSKDQQESKIFEPESTSGD